MNRTISAVGRSALYILCLTVEPKNAFATGFADNKHVLAFGYIRAFAVPIVPFIRLACLPRNGGYILNAFAVFNHFGVNKDKILIRINLSVFIGNRLVLSEVDDPCRHIEAYGIRAVILELITDSCIDRINGRIAGDSGTVMRPYARISVFFRNLGDPGRAHVFAVLNHYRPNRTTALGYVFYSMCRSCGVTGQDINVKGNVNKFIS